MRILAVTTAGSGHLLPMLPVLNALIGAGHEVAVRLGDHLDAVLGDDRYRTAARQLAAEIATLAARERGRPAGWGLAR